MYSAKPHLFWKAGGECRALRDFIYEMEEEIEEERYEIDETEGCLRICQLSKVLSVLCLPVIKGEVRVQMFDRVLRNRYSLYTLFKQMMGLISMRVDDFFELQNTLETYSMTAETVYELFFKFIIHDPEYFTGKEELIQHYFESTEEFFVTLFQKYLITCSERGQQNSLFIEALNSILSLPETSHYAEGIILAINDLEKSEIMIETEDGKTVQKSEL